MQIGLALLGFAGFPFTGGLIGKFYVFAAVVQGGAANLGLLWLVILAIAMSAGLLNVFAGCPKKSTVTPSLPAACWSKT